MNINNSLFKVRVEGKPSSSIYDNIEDIRTTFNGDEAGYIIATYDGLEIPVFVSGVKIDYEQGVIANFVAKRERTKADHETLINMNSELDQYATRYAADKYKSSSKTM